MSKKIVYTVPSLTSKGGFEKVIIYKANYLAEEYGYDVELVAYKQSSCKTSFPLSRKVKLTLQSLKSYFSNCGAIDLLIATHVEDAKENYKVECAKVKIREIHCSVERYIWYSRNPLRRLFARFQIWNDIRVSRHYDHVVLLTEQERQLYWSKENNVTVIPNPLTIQKTEVSDLTQKRVIAVGRISYQKGFDRLAEAWAIVSQKYPDWKLDIIGSREDESEVLKVVSVMERFGLKNVSLLPATNNIEQEYKNCSLLVMPSRYEGFGLVLTEAMACGVPCVSFDCHCGPTDIISNEKDGILVKEGDIKELAQAIGLLIGDEGKRNLQGRNALEKAKQYELRWVMNKWINLFLRK